MVSVVDRSCRDTVRCVGVGLLLGVVAELGDSVEEDVVVDGEVVEQGVPVLLHCFCVGLSDVFFRDPFVCVGGGGGCVGKPVQREVGVGGVGGDGVKCGGVRGEGCFFQVVFEDACCLGRVVWVEGDVAGVE